MIHYVDPMGGQVTAEIAILNKTAVALAADSAITISAGANQHKIFDSADKLFELTPGDPIAIMVNNDMSFMEAPMAVIIKEYRKDAPPFTCVRDAGQDFLEYLDDFAKRSPESIKLQSLAAALEGALRMVDQNAREAWIEAIRDPDTGGLKEEITDNGEAAAEVARQKIDEELDRLSRLVDALEPASFIGEGEVKFTEGERETISRLTNEILATATAEQKDRACTILQSAALKQVVAPSTTGLIFAGFGSKELFPTLVSYEISGSIGNRLKYVQTNHIDIDREGVKARVLPFAQREMVERFLYGLDTPLREQISTFCENAVPKIGEEILGLLDLEEDDRTAIEADISSVQNAFLAGLETEGFEAIQRRSEGEIEDMVEFMPKPEMARMAEALVNLTSIKRRVSRGFETVGGPIDVAIISKAEGFVWVSRKHYFPRELNDRYFARMGAARKGRRKDDAEDMHA